MRNYIILNGTNSNTIAGLLIQELAPISKPLMRTEIEEIDGRDGDIITPLGFSAYDKQITIGLYGTYDINAIIAFFNSEGTVTFSNESDKYYNYQIYDQIDFERLVRFKTATVTLHCQPFKFATTGESQTLTAGAAVSGEGTILALEGSAEAPFSQFDLKGNTEQSGTPAPDAPVPVKVVTGENVIKICGKNLCDGVSQNYWLNAAANSAGKTSGNTGLAISVLANTDYTISTRASQARYRVALVDSLPTGASGITAYSGQVKDGTSSSVTISTGSHGYLIVNATSLADIQIEKSSQATAFEPFQGQSYEVNLGKNLISSSWESGGYNNSTGAKVADSGLIRTANSFAVEPNSTYIVSRNGSGVGMNVIQYMADGTCLGGSVVSSGNSFTTTAQTAKITLHRSTSGGSEGIQLEKGSTITSYAAYFAPIELCKIGDYQDYLYKSGDKWYKHKAINKENLDSSGTWTAGGQGNVYIWRAPASDLVMPSASSVIADIVCSHLKGVTFSDIYYARDTGVAVPSNGQRICVSVMTDVATTKAWLDANTPAVYYALATSVDEEITNTTLIEQLDDIADQAHAYRPRTHISSTYATGNMPFIIAATANGDASGTITNAGNIYSKPKLTVYGSGDIGIYLNGVQMFQIALGSDGYITIDTNLMEAYKDNLQTLKNRQVTGDYSNFKLPVGQSTISFSGIVTSCVVENFSRWL